MKQRFPFRENVLDFEWKPGLRKIRLPLPAGSPNRLRMKAMEEEKTLKRACEAKAVAMALKTVVQPKKESAIVSDAKPQKIKRNCMCCKTEFKADGKYNRICRPCKDRDGPSILN